MGWEVGGVRMDSPTPLCELPRRNLLGDLQEAVGAPPGDGGGGGGVGQGDGDKFRVVLRVRPTGDGEGEGCVRSMGEAGVAGGRRVVRLEAPEKSLAWKNGEREAGYTFSHVFGPEAGNAEVHEAVGGSLAEAMLAGEDSVVLAYGITNAGKTHTIQGSAGDPGLMPRAAEAILGSLGAAEDARSGIKGLGETAAGGGARMLRRRALYVSMCEVYNEGVYDLLAAADEADRRAAEAVAAAAAAAAEAAALGARAKRRAPPQREADEAAQGPVRGAPMRIKEDASGKVWVAGLTEVRVQAAGAAVALMRRGAGVRSRAATLLNEQSSRSHAIFTARLFEETLDEFPPEGGALDEFEADVNEVDETGRTPGGRRRFAVLERREISRVSFADMAGLERLSRTQNEGERLREQNKINGSLMTFQRCLEALRHNSASGLGAAAKRRVPFRESKVTHLLRDIFNGIGRMVLVANVNPSPDDYDETVNVLRYASMASEIRMLSKEEMKAQGAALRGKAANGRLREAGLAASGRPRDAARDAQAKASDRLHCNGKRQRTAPAPAAGVVETQADAPPKARARSGPSSPEGREADESEPKPLEAAGGAKLHSQTPPIDEPQAETSASASAMLREAEIELESLREALEAERLRGLELEAEIREEVAREMSETLAEMEERHAAQLEELRDEVEEECERRQLLKTGMKDRKQARGARAARERAGQREEELEAQLLVAQGELDTLAVQLRESKMAADALSAQEEGLRAETLSLRNALAHASDRARTLEEDRDDATEVRNLLDESRAREEAFKAEVEAVRSELDDVRGSKAAVEQELSTFGGEAGKRIAELEGELSELREAMGEAVDELERSKAAAVKAEAASSALEVELEGARAENDLLTAELEDAGEKIASLLAKREGEEESFRARVEEIEAQAVQNAAMEAEMHKQLLRGVKANRDQLAAEKDADLARIREAYSDNLQLKAECERLRDEVARLESSALTTHSPVSKDACDEESVRVASAKRPRGTPRQAGYSRSGVELVDRKERIRQQMEERRTMAAASAVVAPTAGTTSQSGGDTIEDMGTKEKDVPCVSGLLASQLITPLSDVTAEKNLSESNQKNASDALANVEPREDDATSPVESLEIVLTCEETPDKAPARVEGPAAATAAAATEGNEQGWLQKGTLLAKCLLIETASILSPRQPQKRKSRIASTEAGKENASPPPEDEQCPKTAQTKGRSGKRKLLSVKSGRNLGNDLGGALTLEADTSSPEKRQSRLAKNVRQKMAAANMAHALAAPTPIGKRLRCRK